MAEIAGRIKAELKREGKTAAAMLRDLGMSPNAINQFAKGSALSCVALARIADELNVSLDYLMGRTDDPTAHRKSTSE